MGAVDEAGKAGKAGKFNCEICGCEFAPAAYEAAADAIYGTVCEECDAEFHIWIQQRHWQDRP